METESRFQRLSTDSKQKQAAHIFFDDLRVSYDRATRDLGDSDKATPVASALPIRISTQPDRTDANYPSISQGVLRVFEQNEAAYIVVANRQELTFNLEVSSAPPSATVSYKRRGDDFTKNAEFTNCTLHALPYAIWTIRVEERGYKTEEVEHDPFREPNHVIKLVLER